MNTMMQAIMGLSLAAGAGLRACLPLLCVGLLARFAHLPLNPSYTFLTTNSVLMVLAGVTILEFVGDKIIAIDHLLDGIGTFVRPVAGAILATSVQTKLDPSLAMLLGLTVGGSTALTVHAGKAATRLKSSAFAFLHLGVGSVALSLVEDCLAIGVVVLAYVSPYAGLALALLLLAAAIFMVWLFVHTGKALLSLFRRPANGQTA